MTTSFGKSIYFKNCNSNKFENAFLHNINNNLKLLGELPQALHVAGQASHNLLGFWSPALSCPQPKLKGNDQI